MPRFLPILPLLLVHAATIGAEERREYTIYLVGNEAGELVVERPANQQVAMSYSFNDRGRGPDIEASYRLNESGWPVSIAVSGVDYMKAPVTETLTVEDGAYVWRSAADAGRSAEPGFYQTLDGPPADLELLTRALLQDDDHRLPLLPNGEARLETVGTRTLPDGRQVRQVELHGLGFEPSPLWLTADDRLFALVSGWFTVIEDGEPQTVIETLKQAQDERQQARYRQLAEAAATDIDGAVLIDNARIFDVDAGAVVSANGLLIEDGRISALLEPGQLRPAAAHVVDAHGRTLLPGLWDMHTHLSPADGPLQLAAGVTTVRDLANDHDQLMVMIAAIESGDSVGPHVFRAGFIDGTGPFAGPTKARIETAEQAREWIERYADQGYHQIKIYSSIPTELVPMMAALAHEKGMRFSGHIPAGMWAEDAIRAGFDEIQHVNMLFLNFYKDIVETRNPDRFIKVAERGADLDPATAPFQQFVQLLKDHGTVVDPTVAVFMDLFVHQPGHLAPSLQTAEGRLPPTVRRGNLKGGLPVPEGWETRYQASAQRMLDVIGALYEAGVPLVAGTDGLAGFTLQSELAYYQQAGIPAPAILRLATLGSAEIMGVADEVGRIAPGQRADLILVDGRPDEDIAQINRVDWVMKAGQVIDPAVLYRSLSIQPLEAARAN